MVTPELSICEQNWQISNQLLPEGPEPAEQTAGEAFSRYYRLLSTHTLWSKYKTCFMHFNGHPHFLLPRLPPSFTFLLVINKALLLHFPCSQQGWISLLCSASVFQPVRVSWELAVSHSFSTDSHRGYRARSLSLCILHRLSHCVKAVDTVPLQITNDIAINGAENQTTNPHITRSGLRGYACI